MTNTQRFDDYFFTICKETGGIEGVLNSMLSFLYRRTDFFYEAEPGDKMGFIPGHSRQLLAKTFDYYQNEHYKRFPAKNPEDVMKKIEEHRKKQAESEVKKSQEASAAATVKPTTTEPARKVKESSSTTAVTAAEDHQSPPPTEVTATSSTSQSGAESTVYKSSGTSISTHNGGVNDEYRWAQSMTDVTLEIALPRKYRSKEIQVDFQTQHIAVYLKSENNRCILSGELSEKIKKDDSLWNLDDNLLQITLEKGVETIWKSVIKGGPEIDATKVENSKPLDSFDSETQTALRKIMYEQQRKQMGLPTSEEEDQLKALRSAWDAEGSPFKGTPFDPSKVNLGGGGANPM